MSSGSRGGGMSQTKRRKALDAVMAARMAFPVSEYVRRRLIAGAEGIQLPPASAGHYQEVAKDAGWRPEVSEPSASGSAAAALAGWRPDGPKVQLALDRPLTPFEPSPVRSIKESLKVEEQGPQTAGMPSRSVADPWSASEGPARPSDNVLGDVYEDALRERPEDQPHGVFWIDTTTAELPTL